MTETLFAYGLVLLAATGVAWAAQAPPVITGACGVGAVIMVFLGVISGGDKR